MASTRTAIDVKKTAGVQRSSSIDDPSKARDPSWVFKEFAAFCLYGCPVLTNPKDHLAHFSTGGELQGPKSSRRFAERQKKLDKQKQKFVSVMNEPVAGLIAEQIDLRTEKSSTANSINNLQTSRCKTKQRALCLCETKIENLIAIRAQYFFLYNSFENKGTPDAKVIAYNFLKKLLAMDEEFADVDKEKKQLEIANQQFEDTVGLAMEKS